MFEVRAIVGRNRLHLLLAGHLEEAEIQAATDAVVADLPRLRPGFDVVSDITGLEPLEEYALVHIRRIHQAIVQKGCRRVVRVVGKSAQAAVQLERISREAKLEVYLAYSRAEADRMLDGDLVF